MQLQSVSGVMTHRENVLRSHYKQQSWRHQSQQRSSIAHGIIEYQSLMRLSSTYWPQHFRLQSQTRGPRNIFNSNNIRSLSNFHLTTNRLLFSRSRASHTLYSGHKGHFHDIRRRSRHLSSRGRSRHRSNRLFRC